MTAADGGPPDERLVAALREIAALARVQHWKAAHQLADIADAALRVVLPEGGPRPEMTPGQREEYERRREHWAEVGKPLSDAIHESTDIRAEDLALRAGGQPPSDGMPREITTREWARIRAEAFQRVADFFRETADTKPEWTAQEASQQWQMYADSLRDLYLPAAERGVSAVPPTEEPNE